jgi:hypothetical protein
MIRTASNRNSISISNRMEEHVFDFEWKNWISIGFGMDFDSEWKNLISNGFRF